MFKGIVTTIALVALFAPFPVALEVAPGACSCVSSTWG